MFIYLKKLITTPKEIEELQKQVIVLDWKLGRISNLQKDLNRVHAQLEDIDQYLKMQQVILFG